MRIAINTRFLIQDKMEGFGWYTHEVFKRIVLQHPEHEFIFFFDRKFDQRFVYAPNVTPVKLNPPARHPWLFYLWFEYAVPKALKKYKADLFISPDGYMSLATAVPSIGVIHDLNFEHYPNDLKPSITRYYKRNFPRFARKAAHLLTVSQYSKNDISTLYSIAPEKITVAYNSADELFTKSNALDIDVFKQKYHLHSPFFLAVGAIHARKNIARLLKAFDSFKQNSQSNWKLLLVGNKYTWTPEMKKTLDTMRFKADVVFTGHLPKNELIHAYSAASALVFPSYFEGFGIPLIEAMRCECPVICANATSFPEVAADAALYFDPFDVQDIAQKLELFCTNSLLATTLREEGTKRAQQFSWDKTAEIVWQTIENTAHVKGILK